MRALTRRSLLFGGAGAAAVVVGGVLVDQDVLPGRSRAYSTLGLNGEPAPIPDIAGGPKVTGVFASRYQAGREVGWAVTYPPGSATDARLPVVVALHASQGNHETVFTGGLAMDRFQALVVGEGVPPFALASVDGNGSWLPRSGGVDSGRTVTEELLPILARRGLHMERLGFMGWSAGGYGALLLGATYGAGVRAVGVTSPALTTDDVPDEVDVYAKRAAYTEIPLRVDCGRGDPFYHAVEEFVDGIEPAPAGGFNAGGHTHGYWRRMAPAQLRFIGERLG